MSFFKFLNVGLLSTLTSPVLAHDGVHADLVGMAAIILIMASVAISTIAISVAGSQRSNTSQKQTVKNLSLNRIYE